jgi:hypothetical protein
MILFKVESNHVALVIADPLSKKIWAGVPPFNVSYQHCCKKHKCQWFSKFRFCYFTKKGNNSKMGNGIYLQIARYVDLDMLHFKMLILFVFYFKNYKRYMLRLKLQTSSVCQDLPTLQFYYFSSYIYQRL